MSFGPGEESLTPPIGLASTFAKIAERTGLGIVVCSNDTSDLSGKVVFANGAACQLLGLDSNEVVGQAVESSRFGNTLFVNEDWTERMNSNPILERRGRFVRADGQHILARWCRRPVTSQGRPLVVHLLARVEQVARALSTRYAVDHRFSRIVATAPDGILVFVGINVVYANDAGAKVHGYSDRFLLTGTSIHQLFHADDCSLFDQSVREGLMPVTVPMRALRRDGRLVPVDTVLSRVDWDGESFIMATMRDLAGHRVVTSQLVHTDRLAAVGTLAAGVAHEINNPLAYVLLNLQYLLREAPKLTTSDGRVASLMERLGEARHGAQRVVSIVKDLRVFSKIDEERLGPVDLRRVLMSAISVARAQLGDRGQIVESFEQVRAAQGNSARLEQVFLNLLINAIQALPNRSSESNRIIVRLYEELHHVHPCVMVEVSDTGAGIAPENIDRVFDPFFTTKPVGLGTGLGLPICHSIVTRMGGSITVESTLGKGSLFTVALPVSTVERLATPYHPSPIPARLTRRARILVIDDEVAVATMFSRILDEDHDVAMAASAEQALSLMQEVTFDVMFCDLLMPNMTGMDFFSEVKQRYPGQERRIAFMTGGAFTPRAAQFLGSVANPRLEKPFDLRAVRAVLRQLLSQHVISA